MATGVGKSRAFGGGPQYSASQSRQGARERTWSSSATCSGWPARPTAGAGDGVRWEEVLSSESASNRPEAAGREPGTAYYDPADPRRSMMEPRRAVDAVLGSALPCC